MTEGAVGPRPVSVAVIRPRSRELAPEVEAGAGWVVRVPRAGSPFCSSCEIGKPSVLPFPFSFPGPLVLSQT